MSIIVRKGVIHGGQVFVEEPIDLSDGSEVVVTGVPSDQRLGEKDNDRLTSEEIASTLAAMDKIEPFDVTPEEEAAWANDRQAKREWEKSQFAEQAEKLRRMWE